MEEMEEMESKNEKLMALLHANLKLINEKSSRK